MRKIRRCFESLKVPKLDNQRKKYSYDSCQKLYFFFKDKYDKWQISDEDVFPNLVYVHSIKGKDEMDLRKNA